MMLQAALALACRGMAVFPCQERLKVPATGRGHNEATTNPEKITEWWSLLPNANIGVATGTVSGIFVLDVDGAEAEHELCKLETEFCPLPSSVEAITGKGRHIYFRHPGGRIKTSAGQIAPGIDSRGDGGYVLAPPSIHPSGRSYCWSVDSDSDFADAPAWLIERLNDSAPPAAATRPEQWLEIAQGVPEGARNASLARLAGYFLRRPNLDPLLILELLQGWNRGRCQPPLSDAEVVKIVNSIAGRELKRRRGNG